MQAFFGEGLGRVVVINLRRGEKVLESIRGQPAEIPLAEITGLSVKRAKDEIGIARLVTTDGNG